MCPGGGSATEAKPRKARQIPVERGGLVIRCAPFVAIMSKMHRARRCDNCFRKAETSFHCPSCSLVNYCSAECHSEGLPEHAAECACYRRAGKRPSTSNVRFLVNIILKAKRVGNAHGDFVPGRDRKRTFGDLLCHEDGMIETRLDYINSCYVEIQDFLESPDLPDPDEFIRIYGKMSVNSFEICDNYMVNVGVGLYLGASAYDHSCAPNAHAIFDGRHIELRALAPIADAGDVRSVRITYVDCLDPGARRRHVLRTNYFFECDCWRCTRETKSGHVSFEDGLMSSTRCQKCDDGKILSLFPPFSLDPEEIRNNSCCKSCGDRPDIQDIENYLDVKKAVESALSQHPTPLDMAEDCIMLMTGVMHPTNVLYIQAVEVAFESCIRRGRNKEALEYGELYLRSYRKYQKYSWPYLGIIMLKLAKLEVAMDHPDRAKEYIVEAEMFIKITNGVNHTLYQEVLGICHDLDATLKL